MVVIGSARIDENGNIKGGKAGDQTGKEVSTQAFYMHSKGWVGFKAKDSTLAEKLAKGMQIACDNPNLGYDQNERLGVVRNGIESKVKTECDCSSLVRAVLKYAGVEVCNFTTATAKAVIMATGLFYEVKINSAADVTNGMILCTKTKGHIVIVISGAEHTEDLFGIDVSRHQGEIDWSKVKKDFAIIKITNKGNVVEDKFEQNYKGCIDNNIPVGGYKYVYATTVNEARAEAEGMLKVLNGRKLPYGIWIDMEDKTIRPIGKQALSAVILEEAEILKSAGYDVGIYCNYDWYKNVLDSKMLKYPFWIARYPKLDNGSYNEKSTLSPKSFAVAWQYSSKGKVDGIKGNVDMDVLFVPIGEVFGKKAAEPLRVDNPYPEPTKTLNKGAKGDSVRWVQYELKKRGYDLGRCGIDGDYGSATVKAVKSFQNDYFKNRKEVDGICGQKTIKALKQS